MTFYLLYIFPFFLVHCSPSSLSSFPSSFLQYHTHTRIRRSCIAVVVVVVIVIVFVMASLKSVAYPSSVLLPQIHQFMSAEEMQRVFHIEDKHDPGESVCLSVCLSVSQLSEHLSGAG